MTPNMIVEILKVGLSGLVFLLCGMAYRLLRVEQSKAQPNAQILRTIHRYLWQSILCALIVGLFSIADTVLARQHKAQVELLESCGDSLQRLDTYSKMPNLSADDLRNVAINHVSACGPVINDFKTK
jgi:hypothetical protein